MSRIRIEPATVDRRADIAAVMTDCGDASHCWCAFWSRPRSDFDRDRGKGNERWFMHRLATAEHPPGVLAYVEREAAGWCAVAPRADHIRLARSRILAPVDAAPVWAITCFVIAKRFRRQGIMRRLIDGAVDFARERGATCLEAYPLDASRKLHSGELYVGLLSAFVDAGFEEVARRSPTRPIVRRRLA
ncbi:MAG TPA: GNAT family N-acetyltransferase [Albitalea sp.]|uniref:GNAT family N-acetyltransferase n=1 Tax=Piscinibacter sp. TaxID=1903157 RepID=UPI002ED57253